MAKSDGFVSLHGLLSELSEEEAEQAALQAAKLGRHLASRPARQGRKNKLEREAESDPVVSDVVKHNLERWAS